MAKTIELLTDLKVRNLKEPGLHADGGGLYLRVAAGGSKGWIFRFSVLGKARDMGLGPYPQISLASARKHAEECRALLQRGKDPIEERRARREALRAPEAKAVTFDDCVRGYIEAHEAKWTNPKHRAQWLTTVETYASPYFGKKPVAQVDQADVLKALEAPQEDKGGLSFWRTNPETASRVRGRIESVLGWATARGYRKGANPAAWITLKHLLPPKSKVRKREHFPALPYKQIGELMAKLRAMGADDLVAQCLEFTILTAVRTNEVLGATWDEIDLRDKVWTISKERMKMDEEHRVPLSSRALAILEERLKSRQAGDDFVFPGRAVGGSLSDRVMLRLLQEGLGYGDVTVHGTARSTFRDWSADETNFPNHVCEMALAHAVAGVEGAYRRSDLFRKRRQLMQAWADYCAKIPIGDAGLADAGNIVPMRRGHGQDGAVA
jgi:integrase